MICKKGYDNIHGGIPPLKLIGFNEKSRTYFIMEQGSNNEPKKMLILKVEPKNESKIYSEEWTIFWSKFKSEWRNIVATWTSRGAKELKIKLTLADLHDLKGLEIDGKKMLN